MRMHIDKILCGSILLSLSGVASSDLLPIRLSIDANAFINADGNPCTTSGEYIADTFEYKQTYLCGLSTLVDPHRDWSYTIFDQRTFLNALVDNSGHVIGGTFSWFGIIPELGLDDLTLLGSGDLVDIGVFQGPNVPASIPPGISTLSVFEPFIDLGPSIRFGPYVEWYTFVDFGSSRGWTENWDFGLQSNYTTSDFLYYRRVSVSEPSTLVLLVAGLLGISFASRRRTDQS